MGSNSPKNRDYFITINQGAACYEEALEILKNKLNKKMWAAIYHDKDVVAEQDQVTGEVQIKPKLKHLHIMVELKNPITFQSIRNKFPGAHIEVPKYKKSAYQYLLHNSPNSKEKYQYDFSQIITDDKAAVKDIIESETSEQFKENLILRYLAEGTRTAWQFMKRFGLNVYKQYWKAYSDLVALTQTDEELKADLEAQKSLLAYEATFDQEGNEQ